MTVPMMRLSQPTYAFLTTLGSSRWLRCHPFSSTPALGLISAPAARQGRIAGSRKSRVLWSSSTSFQAPEPPASKGLSVFPDVDLSLPISNSAQQRNADTNAVFVVNGASRGIGLQMVKSLLDRTQGTIVACCRTPHDDSSPLQQFLQSLDNQRRQRIDTFALDLEQQSTIDALEEYLENHHSKRLNGLFNVAGILGDGTTTPGPERSLARIEREWLEHTMAVNVIGHVMLIQALQKLLKNNPKEESNKSVIVNLSARVGSISDNELGGWYSYRMSKAALNQATRTMAHELKRQGTHAIAIHPGTTDTDLSKPFQRNVKQEKLFPVDFTVNQILDVVDRLQDQHSGGLYDWAGKALPF